MCIHGDKSQPERDWVLNGTENLTCVCTFFISFMWINLVGCCFCVNLSAKVAVKKTQCVLIPFSVHRIPKRKGPYSCCNRCCISWTRYVFSFLCLTLCFSLTSCILLGQSNQGGAIEAGTVLVVVTLYMMLLLCVIFVCGGQMKFGVAVLVSLWSAVHLHVQLLCVEYFTNLHCYFWYCSRFCC